jgi:hypothetical protein
MHSTQHMCGYVLLSLTLMPTSAAHEQVHFWGKLGSHHGESLPRFEVIMPGSDYGSVEVNMGATNPNDGSRIPMTDWTEVRWWWHDTVCD